MKTYTKPTVRVAGSVAAITRGGTTGSSLDATFPTGTPFTDLTFS